jgi:hypothetical protein
VESKLAESNRRASELKLKDTIGPLCNARAPEGVVLDAEDEAEALGPFREVSTLMGPHDSG